MTEGFSNIRTCFTLIQTCSNLQNRLVETCLKMQLWTLLALFFGTLTDLVLQVDSRYQRLLITEGFSNIWTCFTLIKLAQNWWNLLAWICRLCRAFWCCRWVLWEAVDDWRGLVLQVGGCQEVPLQKALNRGFSKPDLSPANGRPAAAMICRKSSSSVRGSRRSNTRPISSNRTVRLLVLHSHRTLDKHSVLKKHLSS